MARAQKAGLPDLMAQSRAKPGRTLRWTPMEPERRAHLQARIVPGSLYAQLQDKLLSEIGGDALVLAYGYPEPTLAALQKSGRNYSAKGARMVPGLSRQCHRNAVRLVLSDPARTAVCGYALSDDGAWREHSWALSPDGKVLETTRPRIAYFGIPFEVPSAPQGGTPDASWDDHGDNTYERCYNDTDADQIGLVRMRTDGTWSWSHLLYDADDSDTEIEVAQGTAPSREAAMLAADHSLGYDWDT